MLSEHDRRALRELERRLAAEDAAFVQRFDADPRPRRPARPAGRAGLAQFAGTLLLGMLMLLAGSMAGAVAFFGGRRGHRAGLVVRPEPRTARSPDRASDIHPGDGTQNSSESPRRDQPLSV